MTCIHILRRLILFVHASAVATAGPLVATTRAAVIVLGAASLETVSVDILGLVLVSVSGG